MHVNHVLRDLKVRDLVFVVLCSQLRKQKPQRGQDLRVNIWWLRVRPWSRVLWRMKRVPDLNRGRQFGPTAVQRGDIYDLLRPTMSTLLKKS